MNRCFPSMCFSLAIAGCAAPPTVEDLDMPMVTLTFGSDLCATVVAIDGHNEVWSDLACEAPYELRNTRRISAATRTQINAQLDGLPEAEVAGSCGRANRWKFEIARAESAEVSHGWSGCMPKNGIPDPPFDGIFIRLRDLGK